MAGPGAGAGGLRQGGLAALRELFAEGSPFEVILGLKSRKSGYISHPSLKREIGFGQE